MLSLLSFLYQKHIEICILKFCFMTATRKLEIPVPFQKEFCDTSRKAEIIRRRRIPTGGALSVTCKRKPTHHQMYSGTSIFSSSYYIYDVLKPTCNLLLIDCMLALEHHISIKCYSYSRLMSLQSIAKIS